MGLVNVALVQGRPDELYSLSTWLQRADEFRGRVRTVSRSPEVDEMGTVAEMLTVVVGSGGAAAVLAGALSTWVQSRRARISVEVVAGESGEVIRRVEVDAGTPATTERLLRGLLVGDEDAR